MTSQSCASLDATISTPAATWQYVYGVIPTDDLAIFEVGGLDPAHPVHTVVEGDLAVVTSDVDRESFQGMDRGTVVQYLGAHQRVLETVLRDYPVLPVKFGTTLPTEETLRALLRQGAGLLRRTLADYANQQQHEVVALWDLQQIFQEIANEAPIVALRTQISGGTPEATVDARVALGQLVHAGLQRRRAQVSEQMIAQLGAIASDLIVNPTMNDSMVVNLALLLDATGQAAFDDRLALLDTQFDGRLQIRCVGPLPPYSFAILEVKRLDFAAVEAARQLLALGTQTSVAEIKRAYHQMAAQAHPDLNPSAEHAVADMEALNEAHQLLSMLAKAQASAEQDAGQERPCQLDRAAVEATLLLAVVRQEYANA